MIKRLSCAAVSLLLIGLMVLGAFALDLKPTNEFFVNDYAEVLTEDAKKELMNLGVQLEKLTKAQIVVVTVDTIGNEDIRTCAGNIAREWGIGDKEMDNGILIFLAVKDRNYSIEIGYGLEGAVPDAVSSRVQRDVMNPYFSNDEFSDGMVAGYRKLCALVYAEYGLEMPAELENEDFEYLKEESDSYSVLKIIFIIVIALFIVGMRSKRVRRFGYGRMFSGGSHTGGFGGGFSGGGSGGGGGGGFSGGGGGFGGGGSSSGF